MSEQEGYIYILTNPSFPPYVKIGYADNVNKRVKELNRTECTPFGFRVFAYYKVSSRLKDKSLHALIDLLNPTLRSVDNIDGAMRTREFYAISPEKAYSVLKAVASINDLEENLILVAKTESELQDENNALKIEVRHDKAKPFNFKKANIPAGSKITYIEDDSIVATVCEDLKHVEYNGEIYSLSSLADKLRGKSPSAGPQYFKFNGRELNDIREEIGF
jgi:hypothetical protein